MAGEKTFYCEQMKVMRRQHEKFRLHGDETIPERVHCDICGCLLASSGMYRITTVKDGDKAVCYDCSADTVYVADEAGLIEWRTAEPKEEE